MVGSYNLSLFTSGCYFYEEDRNMMGSYGCVVSNTSPNVQHSYAVNDVYTDCLSHRLQFWLFITRFHFHACAQVLPETNTEQTTCACTHLTSFGGGFAVQPNAIDFDYVFDNADFLSNPTLYVTEMLIVIAYVAVAVWARRTDKQDIKKVTTWAKVLVFDSDVFFVNVLGVQYLHMQKGLMVRNVTKD